MAGFRRLRSGDSTAYFAHCHYLVFIEDVSGKTGPQRWRPLSSNGKLIDEKALIGHGKKAVKVNMLPQAHQQRDANFEALRFLFFCKQIYHFTQ